MAATATPKIMFYKILLVLYMNKSSRVQICEEDSLLGRILMSLNNIKLE